ncbi:MAG TPA: IS5/IS1182 family transposase, partial [Candidatus Binatia bacterium]|nr:IS5/IS1182 family transposase [Candidatus Binatia bacterium]
MRGADQIQGAMFSYVSPEKRVPQDHPLRMIWVRSDAALQEMSPLFD